MNLFFLLFFICSNIFGNNLTSKNSFFLFDVGQGSCNLVKYHLPTQEIIGVLYDAGSSSGVIHPKFRVNTTMPDSLIFEDLKQANTQKDRDSDDDALSPPRPLQDGRHNTRNEELYEAPAESPDGARVSAVVTRNPSMLKDSKIFIKEKLTGLTHLFVFLSHPDSDHISLLPEIIPDNLSITVFLSGDWLGDAGANGKGDDLSSPVKKIIEFLSARARSNPDSTSFCLPYYWDYDLQNNGYQRLKEGLAKEGAGGSGALFKQFRLKFGQPRHVPKEMFQGSLPDLIQAAFISGDILDKEIVHHNRWTRTLSNVHIWALNQSADDANDQSAIVSCTIPDINMSFVFTGDARDLVFRKAQQEFFLKHQRLKWRDLNRNPEHIVWLSLPHHGSEENISPHAYDLFQPNGFLISVGSTSTFGHPSYGLIRGIRKFYKEYQDGQSLAKSFYDRFKTNPSKNCDLIAVEKELNAAAQGGTKYIPRLIKMFGHLGNSTPILCPNIRGHISISQEQDLLAIQSWGFNPIKEYGDATHKRAFFVDYDARIEDKNWNETNKIFNGKIYKSLNAGLYESTDTSSFVWEMTHQGQTYLYKAHEIPPAPPLE